MREHHICLLEHLLGVFGIIDADIGAECAIYMLRVELVIFFCFFP
jgi:hypothetical protein